MKMTRCRLFMTMLVCMLVLATNAFAAKDGFLKSAIKDAAVGAAASAGGKGNAGKGALYGAGAGMVAGALLENLLPGEKAKDTDTRYVSEQRGRVKKERRRYKPEYEKEDYRDDYSSEVQRAYQEGYSKGYNRGYRLGFHDGKEYHRLK